MSAFPSLLVYIYAVDDGHWVYVYMFGVWTCVIYGIHETSCQISGF